MPPDTQPLRGGKEGSRPGNHFRTWRGVAALLALAAVAAAVYAASPLLRPAESDEGTLRGLQIRVLTISQAASENRMDGALAALEALEKDLDDAASQGLISVSRYRGIEAAVESVRTEISGQMAAVSAAAAPAAATAEPSAALEPTQQPVQVAPPPVIVPAPAPVPAPVQQDERSLPEPAKEAKGKGKGQGKP